ncbi:hypothetical protein CWI37_0220p0010 [Hamiltosporidium tvaerminnensis]|uniref:Sec20 C-terminal domain-containing protein n=1 Tax=Hamiltosporidium tvaerminnensis TaxID=1176355 RepID=A0A4Q9LAM0_9MICR|nr:hypothetical protein LUQ84_002524 [Hamiltosporidium tvaerminnensis]TBU03860.1 hypothetical protein CWI37_0220p0010 [Hamiltosporidium tvaerminnensis]
MEDFTIDNLLVQKKFKNEKDLKEYALNIRRSIQDYEIFLYENDKYSNQEEEKIKEMRKRLSEYITITTKNIKNTPKEEIKEEHKEIFETVKLVARQVTKADVNTQLLEKSTLKLKGLNYSNKEIEREIQNTRNNILRSKKEERKEIICLIIGFLVFIGVCFYIILDRLHVAKFIVFLIRNCLFRLNNVPNRSDET